MSISRNAIFLTLLGICFAVAVVNATSPPYIPEEQMGCKAKDHDYAIGDRMKPEDAEPCQVDCTCSENGWRCVLVECPYDVGFATLKPGCSLKKEPGKCCSVQVCP